MQSLLSHPTLLNLETRKLIFCNFAISGPSGTSIFSPLLIPRPLLRTRNLCLNHSGTQHPSKKLDGFSCIPKDVPFDSENLWSNFCLYLFSVHVPMSFGGISAVAHITNLTVLDPHIEALSQLTIQNLELIIVLSLLKYATKPESEEVQSFLKFSGQRKWLLASSAANNPVLKEILQNSDIGRTACFLAYCVITPLLEEIVYRGYLLSTLASKTKWQYAVPMSSLVFSAAHFYIENAFQLFVIGCVLGCSYCWTACFLAYWVITPLLEEIVYRGYLLSTLASKTKWQYAVLMSSLVFSAAHFSIENAFQLFVIGCVLGCSYCWTDLVFIDFRKSGNCSKILKSMS